MNQGIVLHIPHSSTRIPMMDGYTMGLEVLGNEMSILTDWFTDELFDLPYSKVIAPFSRIFCDVERFPVDEDEVMAQFGMGMCYTHRDNGEMMRLVEPELRERIKSEFYLPHHRALEGLTTELLYKYGKVIIVDCHSFTDVPLKRDLNKDIPRPDFCLGIEEYHTPVDLYLPAHEFLTKLGYTVLINNPYSGTMIPLNYYKNNKNVMSIMVEINRKLYMRIDGNDAIKNENFVKVKGLIRNLITLIESNI